MSNILVAESELELREELGAHLRALGYSVIACRNGSETLTCIQEQQPDVAILDLSLDLPAVFIMQNLWEVNAEAVVILIVTDPSRDPVIHALNEGALSYVCKPVNIEEIEAMVSNALKQQRLSLHHRSLVDNLQETNKQLDEQIAERIRAEAALARSEELRRFQTTEADTETERKAPAGELHEETTATLAAIALDVGILLRKATQVSDELREGLAQLITRLNDIEQGLRHLEPNISNQPSTDGERDTL